MKPNEPSRTALTIARQRAAHQVLNHGAIRYDQFAMEILREDEKDVLQFAKGHPLASIGRLITTARGRIAEDALARAVERGGGRPLTRRDDFAIVLLWGGLPIRVLFTKGLALSLSAAAG
jgi:O-methyltransferase involved in polyketide biosynthesis